MLLERVQRRPFPRETAKRNRPSSFACEPRTGVPERLVLRPKRNPSALVQYQCALTRDVPGQPSLRSLLPIHRWGWGPARRDKGALDPLAEPVEIHARDDEERELATVLNAVHDGYLLSTASIYGPLNTGKPWPHDVFVGSSPFARTPTTIRAISSISQCMAGGAFREPLRAKTDLRDVETRLARSPLEEAAPLFLCDLQLFGGGQGRSRNCIEI